MTIVLTHAGIAVTLLCAVGWFVVLLGAESIDEAMRDRQHRKAKGKGALHWILTGE